MTDTLSETQIQKKFKETAAIYASQSGSINNARNKESFYADLDGFVKESLAAGKTPDEIKQDLSRTLNEIRSDGLAGDNRFGDGKITTMQNRADKAMDRVARYYDAVNGIAVPVNAQDSRTPEEKFRESAIAYAVRGGAEKNNENKKSFYADLDLLMCDCLAKGMAPQEMKETINKVLNDINTEILAADHKFAAGKVTTMINWADKAADQVAGYYDVMKKNEGKENMAENLQDVENTTLPAVRGQEMPARTQETQQEQPDLHPVRVEQTAEQEQPDLHPVRVEQTAETVNTVLPAVRGNEMPERAQEPIVLEGQEANLAQSLGNYAQKPSKESFEAFAFDLQHVVADYVGSGMTPAAATQKASELLGQLYDRAESQNLDSQILANLRNAKEAANKFMAQEVEKLNAAPTMLNEVNSSRQDENIEDVEFEEVPAKPAAENEGNEAADAPAAPVNENEGNEADDVPAAPVNENEGNEADDVPAAPANTNEGNEADDVPAAPANTNEGNESEDTPAAPANTNDENVGSFHFGNTAETENINTDIDINKTDDLLEQMMNTAFKNRYMMLEDVENDPSHLCPFRQFKTSTLKDNSGDKKNPYVKMDLESGARVYNRPGQIDVHYDTKEGEDPHVSFEDALALVRLGQEKGWTSANLEGPKEYKEQMFLAMYTLGMKVHGDFIPSEELLKKAEEMRKKYLADAEHAASIDQRFGAIEEKRKAAGIERPEDVGKEFMNSLKKEGLGYQPAQQKDGKEEDKPAPTNDGKDGKEGDDKPAPTNDGKDGKEGDDKPAPTNDGKGGKEGDDKPAPTNDGKDGKEGDDKPAPTNDGKDGKEEDASPAIAVVANNGQEAVQQPRRLQLPEHVESQQQEAVQQPRRLQLPEHVESQQQEAVQQPRRLQLPEHVESQQQEAVQQPQTALVPVTPEIQNKMEAVARTSTTALAKTDPVKAQQAAVQIAATPGIANQLQLAGKTANEAKGNDVKAAQQQRQQETALVLAARNNNHTK